MPLAASAAGLGQINVFSGLGQPLRAEIQISATAQELQSLSARIASTEAFRRANLTYGSSISAIRVSVDTRATRPVIRLSSERPINDPFIDLLVELNWANGQLLREYTFLLDPVDIAAPKPLAATVDTPAAAPVPRAAPTRASAPVASAQTADSYAVRRGDTMHRIAGRVAPAGATLDQTLVALQRANPQAFDGGNMNRLRAGSVLKVPAAESVRTIDAGEARREVRAQAADFEAYRRGLAGTAAARPAVPAGEARQESAGAIVPKVEEPAVTERSGDQVQISQDPEAGDGSALSRLQALEEELATRTAALDEANARLGQLERSLQDLQRLLELQSGTMGQLQAEAETAGDGGAAAPTAAGSGEPEAAVQAAPASAEPAAGTAPAAGVEPAAGTEVAMPPADSAAATAAPAAAAPQLEPSATPVAAPAPEPAQPPQTATPSEPAPRRAPAPAPAPQPEPSFVDTLLADPAVLYGGGGILVLLLAYAGLKSRQRRKDQEILAADATLDKQVAGADSQAVFGSTGEQSVDTGASSIMHTDFSQTGLSSIDTDEGVDPVAEADVYMAYGRDAQAEEILQDALKADPGRAAIYLKLLEIHAQRSDARQFESVATELFSRTGSHGRDWEKAAALGRKLDPENPLYATPVFESLAGLSNLDEPTSPGFGATATLAAGGVAAAAADSVMPEPDGTARPSAPATAEDEPAADEFELSALDFTTSSPVETSHSQMRDTWTLPGELNKFTGAEAEEPVDEPTIDAGVIDFELDLGDEPPTSEAVVAAEQEETADAEAAVDELISATDSAQEGDEGALVFDLDIGGSAPATGQAPEPAAGNEAAGDAVATTSSIDFELPDVDLDATGDRFDLAATIVSSDAAAIDAFDEGEKPSAAEAAAAASAAPSEEPVVDLEKTSFDNSLLDFDFELDVPEAASAATGAMPAGLDLTSIDLDLEKFDEGLAGSGDEMPASMIETRLEGDLPGMGLEADDGGAPGPDNEESETKLELARAYEEMGDNEGALELLREVVAEGSERQQAAARDMIARLS